MEVEIILPKAKRKKPEAFVFGLLIVDKPLPLTYMDNITIYISEISYTYSSANVIGNRDGM